MLKIGILTSLGGEPHRETAELSCFYLYRTSTVLYNNKLNIQELTLSVFYNIYTVCLSPFLLIVILPPKIVDTKLVVPLISIVSTF